MVEPSDLGGGLAVQRVTGFPSFGAVERREEAMLLAAGMPEAPRFADRRASPTTFHVVGDPAGLVVGVAASTVGPFAELPLGLALAAAGHEPLAELSLPDPCCELVSLSIAHDRLAEGGTTGATEALYASYYAHAKQADARSLVVGLDPWLYDVIREEYGIPFEILGPPLHLLGRELLAVGGPIGRLELGVSERSPEFAAQLGIGR